LNYNNAGTDKNGVNNHETAEKIASFERVEEETIHQSSKCSESCETEEDKLPETPTSADAMLYMHRKLMLYEKRESGAEESVDSSVASEVESGDPSLTIDRLKTALKNEQRALSVIYQELEEERSASAIATNQTMAMITRLQEEKAAMQMEALQYQRMMEEQAEYDQEALQLLNDLMTKREREKQELEKELEEYREKVMEYEAKEKLSLLRRMKDGSVRSRDSCCSCCNTGYTDELSIDLNNEEKEEENNASVDTVSNLEEIALECVKHVSELDSTLEEFEEEKASILDQLKALEEKIVSLEDGEEFLEESSSRYGDKEDYFDGCLAKKLLPYLDEAENENDEEAFAYDKELENESNDMQMQNTVPIISEMDSMKVCIEEEVDRVYDRLQALETDREFLQHCMGSIQNGGDEGKDLLQEILQHLRDLKNVELRLKNLDNDPSSIVMLHSPSKDL
jgi:chromosome segregation ATPase